MNALISVAAIIVIISVGLIVYCKTDRDRQPVTFAANGLEWFDAIHHNPEQTGYYFCLLDDQIDVLYYSACDKQWGKTVDGEHVRPSGWKRTIWK